MANHKLAELEQIFLKYCNYDVWLEGKETDKQEILLSQIIMWFKYASLLDMTVNVEQLRSTYLEHQKWSMDFDDFNLYLYDLCKAYNLNNERIRKALMDTQPKQFFKKDEDESERRKRKSTYRRSSSSASKRLSVGNTKVE